VVNVWIFTITGKQNYQKYCLNSRSVVPVQEFTLQSKVSLTGSTEWSGSSVSHPTLSLARYTLYIQHDTRRISISKDFNRVVRFYSDPVELDRSLDEGRLHVVYPDLLMRGCRAVYEQSPEKQYDAPPKRDALFHESDPASHWWFAWLLSRVDHGPHH